MTHHARRLLVTALLGSLPAALLPAQAQFQERLARASIDLLNIVPGGLGIADIDGDGNVEVVGALARAFFGAALVTATDTIAAAPIQTVGRRGLEFLDLDNDGDLDALLRPRDGLAAVDSSVFFNDGAGAFADAAISGLRQVNVHGIDAGDIDGDGDMDLVAAFVAGPGVAQSLVVFENLGAIGFHAIPSATPMGLPFGCWPQLADLDGDGDLDVIASSISDRHVMLTNDGTGVFSDASAQLPAMPLGYVFAATGDFDNDGAVDVASVWFSGRVDMLWGGPGGFAFAAGATTVAGTRRTEPADLDGDGDLDMVLITADGIDIGDNLGARQYARTPLISGGLVCEGIGDLDGDGRVDLVVHRSNGPNAAPYYNTTSGFVDGSVRVDGIVQVPELDAYRQAAIAGDVDGDGRTDLVIAGNGGLVVQHALGAGRYVAGLMPFLAADAGEIQRMHLVDLDLDNDLDLVMTSGPRLRTYQNNGLGRFTAWQALPDSNSDTVVAVGDVDGDGLVDLVRGSDDTPTLYRNLGGSFGAPITLVPFAAFTSNIVVLADLDGDADLDLVTDVSDGLGGHRILENDGNGNFASNPAFFGLLGRAPRSARAGDVDNDGDVDLVVRSGQDRLLLLLRNDGTGGMIQDGAAIPGLTPFAGDNLIFEDLDADGDRDLFVIMGGSPTNSMPHMLLNDGSGNFTVDNTRWDMPAPSANGRFIHLVAADFDDDGDLDISVGAPVGGQFRLAYNHLRQLRSAQAPTLGGSIELELLSGPGLNTGGIGLVFGSFGQRSAPLQVPGIVGAYDLGTASIATLGLLVPDSAGLSSLVISVAPTPSLSGTRLFFQALAVPAVGPAGFSNTTFDVLLP